MKKGLVLAVLSLVIFSVGLATAVWCPADEADSPTGCVCDHTPNYTLGYGQVIIGSSVYSCNNIVDGLCPEDFADPTGFTANCSSCQDPDCTGTVSGTVRDSTLKPIDRVVVGGGPIPFNLIANLIRFTITDVNGLYNYSGFVTGTYSFIASKDSYDDSVETVTVIRGKETTVNFILNNGTCHDDCTNSYNRCNAYCDGITFNDSGTKCQFYNETPGNNTIQNDTVKKLCHNKMKGTEVYLGPVLGDPVMGWFIKCCGDDPAVPYPKYYSKASAICNAKNVIRTEKIARYNDVPVRVIINYWD
jgi:hypothetical protein